MTKEEFLSLQPGDLIRIFNLGGVWQDYMFNCILLVKGEDTSFDWAETTFNVEVVKWGTEIIPNWEDNSLLFKLKYHDTVEIVPCEKDYAELLLV